MKKTLLLVLTSMMFSVMSWAQEAEDWRIHPDDANYKIYGTFETTFKADGEASYELTEVNPVGLVPSRRQIFGRRNHRW